MDHRSAHRDTSHPVSRWYSILLGALLVLLGLVIGIGGIWLIALGGSWYYAIAGIGLLISGVLMVMGRYSSVLVYAATYVFTVIWALWEVGLEGWPLVPRIVAPTVILLLVLLAIPALRRRDPHPGTRRHGMAIAMAMLAALGIGLTAAPWIRPTTVLAQAETEEGTAPAAQTPVQPPADTGIVPPAPPADGGIVAQHSLPSLWLIRSRDVSLRSIRKAMSSSTRRSPAIRRPKASPRKRTGRRLPCAKQAPIGRPGAAISTARNIRR